MGDSINSGSKLDKFTAEKVMGWELIGWDCPKTMRTYYSWEKEGEYKRCDGDWNPSTYIADSWELVKAIPNLDYFDLQFDGKAWVCCMEVQNKCCTNYGYGSEAPVAICQAALETTKKCCASRR